MDIENKVRVFESEIDEIRTKVLWLEFSAENDLKRLFTPKLASIFFIKDGISITVNLSNDHLRDFFNEFVENFKKRIKESDTNEDLIFKFNKAIKELVNIGRKGKTLSSVIARGLFGELTFLKKHLLEETNHKLVLEGWHRPEPANHDFDYENRSVEIKTISRSNTTVKIASEFQLESYQNTPLFLVIYRIETVNKSETDSVGKLYNEIKEILGKDMMSSFEVKCAEDIFCSYLGPETMKLDFKFSIIEELTYAIDQENFPRIKRENLLPSISEVSYRIDVSALDIFKL